MKGSIGCFILLVVASCTGGGNGPSEEPTGTGFVEVTISTTGVRLPSLPYKLDADGVPLTTVQPNDTVVVAVLAGSSFLHLTQLPANCAFVGPTAQVIVAADDTTSLALPVLCKLGLPGRWLGVCSTKNLCEMDAANGTWATVLSGGAKNLASVSEPHWSPDRLSIAFAGTTATASPGAFPDNVYPRIWAVNSDGTALRAVAGTGKNSDSPHGSPDWLVNDVVLFAIRGGVIAKVADTGGVVTNVYSNAAYLIGGLDQSTAAGRILGTWKVAGTTGPSQQTVQTMSTSGSGLSQFSPNWSATRYFDGGAWSPDGQMIAFVARAQAGTSAKDTVVVAAADKTGYRAIVGGAFDSLQAHVSWSPDGAYLIARQSNGSIWILTTAPTPIAGFPFLIPSSPSGFSGIDWRE